MFARIPALILHSSFIFVITRH